METLRRDDNKADNKPSINNLVSLGYTYGMGFGLGFCFFPEKTGP